MSYKLLTVKNFKVLKGLAQGYNTAILHLSPEKVSGYGNVCASATEGCKAVCLNTSGHGRYSNVQNARKERTRLYFLENQKFKDTLREDIDTFIRRSKKNDLIPVFRLNGTSDLPMLAREFALEYPEIMFYDYTAHPKPWTRTLPNYDLTFSLKENNTIQAMAALENGIRVAAVFDELPETYLGYKVINGENSDLRFLEPKNVIVGLTPKGKARHDKTGFVIRTRDKVLNRRAFARRPGEFQIHPSVRLGV